jgi:shikimate 5-dehydrogenase
MIYAIIGHRGVGKSSFVTRVKSYYQERQLPVHIFDLDQEIERRAGLKISEIFNSQGEASFRQLETQVLEHLFSEIRSLRGAVFVAVGAGYMGSFPPDVNVWWLRRPTDATGRIFLDRPQLEPSLDPLTEFAQRRLAREERFRKIYHREFMLSESWDTPNPHEAALIGLRPANIGASFTILPEHVQNPLRLEDLLQSLLQLGVKWVELRNDLLDEATIRRIAGELPNEKVLISFRVKQYSPEFLTWAGSYQTDWAIELGASPFVHNFIVSLHTRLPEESVEEASQRLLENKAEYFKFAVPVHDFVELWSGHRFYLENPETRSFLPMSVGSENLGRWAWYRLSWGRKMTLSFVRQGQGSSEDQPTLFEFLRFPRQVQGLAAVVGWPVNHSRTPAEQQNFFAKFELGTVAIPVREEEFHSLTLSVLERLGARALAVTSPLKRKALDLCKTADKTAKALQAVNTMALTEDGWVGTNTDQPGLRTILESLDVTENAVVWGGGGTRQVLQSLMPMARFYSARYGHDIASNAQATVDLQFSPDVLIWAVGRDRMQTAQWPPLHWRPQLIVDLNYTEDSPGLEYAKRVGARYLSGLPFFKAQAALQRVFWGKTWEEKQKTVSSYNSPNGITT